MSKFELKLYRELTPDQIKEKTDDDIESAIDEYSWDWSFLQEPLQNAIDSFIDPAGFKIYTPESDCKIFIDIDLDRDLITITDNGRGIDKSGFDLIKSPGGTSKRPTKFKDDYNYRRCIKGFAGIGLKSAIYQSDRFAIISRHNGIKRNLRIADGYTFRSFPPDHTFEVQEKKETSPNGTKVIIGFPEFKNNGESQKVTQKLLDLMVDTWMSGLNSKVNVDGGSFKYAGKRKPIGILEPGMHIIQWYLLTQTYAGCITRTLGDLSKLCQDIGVHIKIIGNYTYKNVKFKNNSEHEFWAQYWDPEMILGKKLPGSHKNSKLLKQRKKVAYKKIEDVFSATAKHGYYYKIIEQKSGVKKFLKAGGSTNAEALSFAEDFVNGIILYIAKAEAIRRDLRLPSSSGLGPLTKRLSVCGVPTKHVFDFEIPGFPAVHLVVDINAKVTASKSSFTGSFRGKTGKMLDANGLNVFTKELQKIIASKLVSKVAAKENEGGGGGGGGSGLTPDPDDEHKPEDPTDLLEQTNLKQIFDRTAKITQEQDVIQAFIQYCSANKIPLGWRSIHQKADYDAWISDESWVKIAKSPQKGEGYAVVEFKRDITGILSDTEQGLGQLMEEIDIIVCNDDPMDEVLTNSPYKGFTFVAYDEDEKGRKANFYPTLADSKLDILYPIRVWKGGETKKSKPIKISKNHCLVISMQRIYDFEPPDEEE